jgi:hypothetical protein
LKRAGDVAGEVEGPVLVVGGGFRLGDGPLSGGEAAARDGGHGVEVGAGGDAEFDEASNGAEVEEGGAEAAAGEAQADAAAAGGRRFAFGVGGGEVGVGRYGSGGC